MKGLRRDDEGSIAPMVPALIVVLLLLGGLVIDGSRELNARGDAQGYAEEAARAGATAIDPADPRLALDSSTDPTDTQSVSARVTAYCKAVLAADSRVVDCALVLPFTDGTEPTTDCNQLVKQPLVVHTAVTMRINTTLLGMVGLQALTASGTGKARPYQGTNQGNAC